MSKISKRVSARLSSAQYVASSVQTNQEKVAAAVAREVQVLTPQVWAQVIAAFAAYLARSTQALDAQEQAYADEQADDPAAMAGREHAERQMRGFVNGIRSFVRAHAPHRLRALGLLADPPLAQAPLATYVKNVASQLAKEEASIPGLLGMELKPKEASQALAQQLAHYQASVEVVGKEKRELEAALVERDRALDHWQVVYQAVGDILSGLYRIAGEGKLASQIRPTARRVRGEVIVTDTGEDQPTDPADAPAAQAASAATAGDDADAGSA